MSCSFLTNFLFSSYLFRIHVLFISYSNLIYALFISYQFPSQFLFISYSCLIYIYISYAFLIHVLFILAPFISKVVQKKWLIKGVVSKVLGLDGWSIPIQFVYIPYSCPMHSSSFHVHRFSKKVIRKWKEANEEEKKANAANDPIQNLQYIIQYKTQSIVPNTFSNKESIAHLNSLHNQLKKV